MVVRGGNTVIGNGTNRKVVFGFVAIGMNGIGKKGKHLRRRRGERKELFGGLIGDNAFRCRTIAAENANDSLSPSFVKRHA